MDIKFIDIDDNRSAYEADNIEDLFEIGVPAGTIREWFVRLGNVSGEQLSSLPVMIEGYHADRITLSFHEFGGYADQLTIDSLGDGSSKNLYLRLTMPETVATEDVTTYLVVGIDRLPIRYQAAAAMDTLFDPYPLYAGTFTEAIWNLFADKPIHRFIRFDPIENDQVYTTISVPCGVKFNCNDRITDLCTYLSPSNHNFGYEEPTWRDLRCVPTPRDFDSPERWTEEGVDYAYGEQSQVFLQPNFLNEFGGEPPLWRRFSHEPTSDTDLFKRSHFLMLRAWGNEVYHLEHLHPVLRGQELAYFKADLKPVFEGSADNRWRYNPFAQVYSEDTDRVVRRFPCRSDLDISSLLDTNASGSTIEIS